MKCPCCKGAGELYASDYEGEPCICPKCQGEGEIFDLSDHQPWDIEHPGWGRFEGHTKSKWKTRFVVSGCENLQSIIEFLHKKTGIEYACLHFSESKIFPGENETYVIPCVYFFPAHDRDFTLDVTKSELTELYWY
ncbi:MAG: hypothetical protein WC358_06410 [Ignavibacteria bacterium]|jgi:hypothetical protein